MILPERLLGRSGAIWIRSGVAMAWCPRLDRAVTVRTEPAVFSEPRVSGGSHCSAGADLKGTALRTCLIRTRSTDATRVNTEAVPKARRNHLGGDSSDLDSARGQLDQHEDRDAG